MKRALLSVLLVFIVGCSGPQYGMGMKNSTGKEFKEAAFQYPVKLGVYNLSTTNFTPGALFVFYPHEDRIPDRGEAIWTTKDGKEHRQQVEIGRLPDQDGSLMIEFTDEGVTTFFWPHVVK